MANQQIVEFIKHSLAEGKPQGEVLDSLRKVGWPEAEIQAAKAVAVPPVDSPSAPSPQPPPLQEASQSQPKPLQALPQSQTPQSLSPKVSPVIQPSQPLKMAPIQPQAVKTPVKSNKKIWFIVAPIATILLLLAGGGVFAYQKGLIFARAPFSPEEILEKGLAGAGGVNKASYQFNFSFRGEPREADAEPFKYIGTQTEEEKSKYKKDIARVDNLRDVMNYLESYMLSHKGMYPTTLSVLVDSLSGVSYVRAPDSRSYTASIVLETTEATTFLKKELSFLVDGASIKFEGQKISISSGAKYGHYMLHLPSELPKPALVEALEGLGQMASYFSRETNITGEAKGSGGQDGKTKLSETNLSLGASFGDSSYAFGADIMTKDKTFYVRLNKFPSLPGLSAFFDPALIKGKWVEITEEDLKDNLVDLPVSESLAKENTIDSAKALEAYKKMLAIAKEEKLIKVNGLPKKEKVDNTTAFRYDLSLNRQALASVYRRYMEEVLPIITPEKDKNSSSMSVDESLIEYLASDEFKAIYDYLAKNNSLSVWFSREGYPVQAILRSRIVPSDGGFGGFGEVAGKASTSKKSNENQSQFVLETTFKLQNINKSILPKMPTEFLSFEEAYKLLWNENNPLEEARGKAKDASVKAALNSFRAYAEIYYDNNKKSYGPGFASAPCPSSSSTLKNIFTDKENKKTFEQIATTTKKAASRCAASDQSYAVATALISNPDTYWCVDSSGSSKLITDKKEEELIAGKGTKASPYKCAL